jgi:hypothetical protein
MDSVYIVCYVDGNNVYPTVAFQYEEDAKKWIIREVKNIDLHMETDTEVRFENNVILALDAFCNDVLTYRIIQMQVM